MVQNKAFMYNSVPHGWPEPGKDISIEAMEFDADDDPPEEGITAKSLYVCFDPFMRSSMRDPAIKSFNTAMETGKPVNSVTVVAKVLKSASGAHKEGDTVLLMNTPVQEYTIVTKDKMSTVKHLNPAKDIPVTAYVGALGLTGLTGYGGLFGIGRPKKGETILVSAAAGSVGQVVGQLAVKEGLKVIGTVGSDEKLDFIIKELGYTSGINYKKERITDALSRLAPEGLDIYWDNVGGEILDAALFHMKYCGRIVACGTVSAYNSKPNEAYGVKNYVWINRKSLKYEGFTVFDPLFKQYEEPLQENVSKWIRDGTFKNVEHIVEGGIDNAIEAFMGLFRGTHTGRTILKVADT